MSLTHDDILRSALQLSESERLALATELLESVDENLPGSCASDDHFIEELERRASDGSPGIPWENVKRSIEERLR